MLLITKVTPNDTSLELLGTLANSDELPFYCLPWGTVVTMALILVIAPYFSLLGIRFFKDQPLNKQCILNQLCRDGAMLQTVFVSLWAIYVVGMKCIQAPENEALFLEITKYISFTNETIFFTGILYLCLIAFLRIHTMVYQILDPWEDWLGVNERMALALIRLGISFIVLLIVGLIFMTSATPIIYYKLTEQDLKWKNIPMQSRLKVIFNITCCILCISLFVAGKIYQHRRDSIVQAGHHCEVQTGTNSAGEEIRRGNQFANYISLASMLYLFSFVLVLSIILLLYLNVIHVDIWWGITTLIGIQGVVMPTMFIVVNQPFRHYCLRQARSDINNVIRRFYACTSIIKQHNAQVSIVQ